MVQITLIRKSPVSEEYTKYRGQWLGALWSAYRQTFNGSLHCCVTVGDNHIAYGQRYTGSFRTQFYPSYVGDAYLEYGTVYAKLWRIGGIPIPWRHARTPKSIIKFCRRMCEHIVVHER